MLGLNNNGGPLTEFWKWGGPLFLGNRNRKGTRSRGAGVARATLFPAVVACRPEMGRPCMNWLCKKTPARGPLGTGGGVGPLVSATNIDLRAIGLS
jgi:hypothetical protein